MNDAIESAIKKLATAAEDAHDSADAMRFAQAALSLAHVRESINHRSRTTQ